MKNKNTAPQTICYCFGYTDADIRQDLLAHHGESTIMQRIMQEKKEGRCNCVNTNPKRR